MATGQDVGFLKESSNENSNESASTPGTARESILGGRGVRALSSPAILEFPKGEFRYQDNGSPTVPLRKHLSRSCPHPLSEETPLNSNAESSEHEESDQGNDGEQMDLRRSSYCTDFFDGCLDSIVQFRNSKLIHVLQIMFVPLPISAVVMGLKYADRCRYLPIFSAVIGIVGIIFIGLWIAMTVFEQRGTPCLDQHKFIIGFIFLTLVVLVAIDTFLVGQMSPSFTEGNKNYCIKTFYEYSIKKGILTAAAFALAAIFYLPRSRHCLCFCDCCSSQPPLPNVQYLSI